MKKLWSVLSVIIVLSLVWCVIPVFGGWSWCGDDPIFQINGTTVNVWVAVDSGTEIPADPSQVKVVLRVSIGTDVVVVDPGGFNVSVVEIGKLADGEVEVHVVIPESAVPGGFNGMEVIVELDPDGYDGPDLPIELTRKDTDKHQLWVAFEMPAIGK